MPRSVRRQRIKQLQAQDAALKAEASRTVVSSKTQVRRPLRQMGIIEMLDYLSRNEILGPAKTDEEYVAATQQAREVILLGRRECSPFKEILHAAEQEHAID